MPVGSTTSQSLVLLCYESGERPVGTGRGYGTNFADEPYENKVSGLYLDYFSYGEPRQ